MSTCSKYPGIKEGKSLKCQGIEVDMCCKCQGNEVEKPLKYEVVEVIKSIKYPKYIGIQVSQVRLHTSIPMPA